MPFTYLLIIIAPCDHAIEFRTHPTINYIALRIAHFGHRFISSFIIHQQISKKLSFYFFPFQEFVFLIRVAKLLLRIVLEHVAIRDSVTALVQDQLSTMSAVWAPRERTLLLQCPCRVVRRPKVITQPLHRAITTWTRIWLDLLPSTHLDSRQSQISRGILQVN